MEVFADILPSVNLVKSESTTKDRQQPNRRYKQIKSAYVKTGVDKNQLIGTK